MEANQLPFDIEARPSYQLWLASNAWVRWVKRALLSNNITHVQFGVLSAIKRLGESGTSVSQAQVSRKLSMDENMVSQVIRLLAKRGLVERTRDARDRRAQTLVLTPHGEELCLIGRAAVRKAADEFFGTLDVDNQESLAKMLQQLVQRDSELEQKR